MSVQAMVNAAALAAGLIDALPTQAPSEPATVEHVLKPFTKAGIESLVANNPEIQRLLEEDARKLYATTLEVVKFSTDGLNTTTVETVDVQGANEYAIEIIRVYSALKKAFGENTPMPTHLGAQLDTIKVWLKSMGFNTQHGSEGLWAIDRVAL